MPKEYRMSKVWKAVGKIFKWLFLGSMCVFTVYPVVYAVLGSLKSNAELTLGGNLLPKEWHF